MQVVPDFVDCTLFWFCEGWRGVWGGTGECVLFEEKADFIAGGEEVGVPDVGAGFAG